jgi:phospholipase C
MAYPIKLTESISPNQTLSVPFIPAKPGLVKAILSATWFSSETPPSGNVPPDEMAPTKFRLGVQLDLLKPGSPAPVASKTAAKTVGSDPREDLGRPRVVLWADTFAGAADIGIEESSDAIAFLPVSMNGDGKTQIVQLRNNGGRLGMVIYSRQPDGSYVVSWSTTNTGQGASAIAFFPVTMNGDGKTQILQLWNNAGRLGMIVYSPQVDGSYAVTWGAADVGRSSDAVTYLPVTMNGDGRTQIVQLQSNAGRLGLVVYTPQASGSYFPTWGTSNIGQGAAAIAFLPVTMNGDGKTQIVQLFDNGGRLGMIVYAPQANGSYTTAWGTVDAGEGSPALAFLPVTMNGDGRTQIAQLWNNGGRLGLIVYSPQANGSYAASWGTADTGQSSDALKFLPVNVNGDGKTQLVQLRNNGGRLGMVIYSPQRNGTYAALSSTLDLGQGAGALAFLPVRASGKTNIVQLWDHSGRLGLIEYAPRANGPYVAAWSTEQSNWVAKITNTGEVSVTCDVTVRYQTVEGNLGKIDHVVVLMMENRSFDHMLGYLTLEKNRSDVDGLTGSESNMDDNHVAHAVHHRTDTYFRNDPGHGWVDVRDQLAFPSLSTGGNLGFVHNFAKVLAADAAKLPPQMAVVEDQGQIVGGDSRGIAFRPDQPGPIMIVSTVDRTISRSESGKLGSVTLLRSGGKPPLTQITAIGAASMGLQYTATIDDLASPGDWTCSITNGTETTASFRTTVTYVRAQHDLSLQEPASAVMSYYNGEQLPAYDLLAREYAICDRWFSSLPTDTWPNRLYSLTGGSDGIVTTPSTSDVAQNPPAYSRKTIFETLHERGLDWKVFFQDIPFALVFKKFAQDAQYTRRLRTLSNGDGADFQHAVETGDLPALSWIDPNFSDLRESAAAASDDHPPGDVLNGQQLVSRIYTALANSPAWTRTLFIITYDEHGGFYDHVPPPGLSESDEIPGQGGPPDDNPRLRRYGVRVPAFVISPWVPRGSVSHDIFDHTALLATVLRRFCPDAAGSMGERVAGALDVGGLLSLNAPRVETLQIPEIPAPSSGVVPTRTPNSFGEVLRRTVFGI